MADTPDKRITISRVAGTVEIQSGGEALATTRQALVLEETGYPPRYYVPAMDVRTERLLPSDTRTRCPYKGEAEYFHFETTAGLLADVAWSYPEPLPEVREIAGHIAFHQEVLDPVRIDGQPAT